MGIFHDREIERTPRGGDESVTTWLRMVEASYREAVERADRLAREIDDLRESLADSANARALLHQRLDEEIAAHERESKHARRERKRAEKIAEHAREMHRAMFAGGIPGLILRACLSLTGASRGLYVMARSDGRMRVRAAVDVVGYPGRAPSPYIEALCRKALDSGETFVCDDATVLTDVPLPSDDEERFANCVVAPVVLRGDFGGVVIAADKVDGNFDHDDVELLLSVGQHASVAVENSRLHRELQHAYLATVSALADAAEAHDPYTHGHCEAVARYARLIADEMKLDEHDRAVVCYAALLHDVGKIGVSDGVLHKPGPLLPEEMNLVRSHVRVGHDLVASVPALAEVAHVVLHHHEWYDGTGYPDGLAAEDIPVAARIVAVVDAYCAMLDRRAYKEAYDDMHARDELRRFAGRQFDPLVVEALLLILDRPEAQDGDADFDAECGLLPALPVSRAALRSGAIAAN